MARTCSPSLRPTHCPAPSPPRVNLHESPRVVATSPLSTSPTWLPSTAVRPPPQPAATSLTPVASAPTFHVTPCRLVFGNNHSPRVVTTSQQPLLPPAAPVLPVQEPIAHCTRSRAPAALALFASGGQFHECIQYRIPTAKSARASSAAMGLRGSAPSITCQRLRHPTLPLFAWLSCTKTTRWLCQFSTLQPAICWSIVSSDVTLGIR
jgi:hypothetical protein